MRIGDWKAVRLGVKRDANTPVQLFNLEDDPAESKDVAADHPDVVRRAKQLMREGRTESPIWPLLPRS